jgi:hypothetical protein
MPDIVAADSVFASFGIDADTGRPLPDPDPALFTAQTVALEDAAAAARRTGAVSFGATVEINEEDLADAGWGIVFADDDADADAIEAALAPLIDLRRAEAGTRFRVFKGADGIRADETAESWLDRHGVGLDLVDPVRGVPYYLLLIGGPDRIPPEFQYRIDLYWSVGRLSFATVADYAVYAANVAAYERAATPAQSRTAAVFAPVHDGDPATTLFQDLVARPLVAGKPLNDFAWDPVLAADATKAGYADILAGTRPGGSPALIFSGGHGMAFRADDARLPEAQGALVCQDWPGFGSIDAGHWFAAGDLPPGAATAAGSIYLLFACYGGGYGAIDTFRDRGAGRRIADRPGVARLPQALLANPAGGPLAVIAHIDRAFAYSFATLRLAEQSQGFRSVLGGLMLGRRVGSALDRFNVKWATIATQIADASRDPVADPAVQNRLLTLWIARDDARNYVVYGDPAVRLHPALTKPPLR